MEKQVMGDAGMLNKKQAVMRADQHVSLLPESGVGGGRGAGAMSRHEEAGGELAGTVAEGGCGQAPGPRRRGAPGAATTAVVVAAAVAARRV